MLKAGKEVRSAPEWIVLKAFGFKHGTLGSPPDADNARLHTLAGTRELTADDLPMLVRFRDINDPKSIERVNPSDLAASFGPGVIMAAATIEITNDQITTGIEARLPWLDQYYDKRLDGERYEHTGAANPFANSLSAGVFKTWR